MQQEHTQLELQKKKQGSKQELQLGSHEGDSRGQVQAPIHSQLKLELELELALPPSPLQTSQTLRPLQLLSPCWPIPSLTKPSCRWFRYNNNSSKRPSIHTFIQKTPTRKTIDLKTQAQLSWQIPLRIQPSWCICRCWDWWMSSGYIWICGKEEWFRAVESQRVPLQLLNLISDNSPFPKVSSLLPCLSEPAR